MNKWVLLRISFFTGFLFIIVAFFEFFYFFEQIHDLFNFQQGIEVTPYFMALSVIFTIILIIILLRIYNRIIDFTYSEKLSDTLSLKLIFKSRQYTVILIMIGILGTGMAIFTNYGYEYLYYDIIFYPLLFLNTYIFLTFFASVRGSSGHLL